MMNNWDYKGFRAVVEFSEDDDLLVGKIADIDSLIMFSADKVLHLRAEFHKAVDEYLEHCEVLGVEPQKPYKGTFNVRCGPEHHRNLDCIAKTLKISLNEAVKRAIGEFVEKRNSPVLTTSQHVLLIHGEEEFPMQLRARTTHPGGPYSDRSMLMSAVNDEEQYGVIGRAQTLSHREH